MFFDDYANRLITQQSSQITQHKFYQKTQIDAYQVAIKNMIYIYEIIVPAGKSVSNNLIPLSYLPAKTIP